MKIINLLLVLAFFALQICNAQNKSAEAEKIFKKGFQLAEDGYIDKGLMYMEEAMEMEPNNLGYAYEVAFIYTILERHDDAIEILEKLAKRKDAPDLVYQLLGNNYDWDGNSEKAIKTYNEGLKLHPNSGKLNLELGNMATMKKDYKKALEYYETGIKVEPYFPSNYFNAASLHFMSGDDFLGLMYSEIFMNLERKSKRTVEASKGIYNYYKRTFTVDIDKENGKIKVNVNYNPKNNSTTNKDSLNEQPFFTGAMFVLYLATFIKDEYVINYESICRIRQRMLDDFFEHGASKEYYNAVFEWQKQLKEKELFDAYNHWIISQGEVESFKVWMKENQSKLDEFVNWVENKSIPLEGKDGKLFLRIEQ